MHVATSVLIGNLSWVIESDSCFLTLQQNQISDIIPAILSAEVVIAASNDWRLQETIIDHFKCFQHLTNSEILYQKILPVLLNKLRRAVSVFLFVHCSRSVRLDMLMILSLHYWWFVCFWTLSLVFFASDINKPYFCSAACTSHLT